MTTILCIDDDRDTLELRQRVLQTSGYSVLTAGTGADGLRMLNEGAPVDLVLLDYLMPGMNGDKVAESLKSSFPDLPVIAVSAVQYDAWRVFQCRKRIRRGLRIIED